jgi:hypothetical protein
MKSLLTVAVVTTLVALAGCVHATPFTTYTVDYVRSPNLQPGCASHQGPGCEPKNPVVVQDRFACFLNETYTGEFCGVPVVTYWRTAADLIPGCSNRYAPGCEIPNSPPLTSEGCYVGERLIALVPAKPWLGARCMVRAQLSTAPVAVAAPAALEQQ